VVCEAVIRNLSFVGNKKLLYRLPPRQQVYVRYCVLNQKLCFFFSCCLSVPFLFLIIQQQSCLQINSFKMQTHTWQHKGLHWYQVLPLKSHKQSNRDLSYGGNESEGVI